MVIFMAASSTGAAPPTPPVPTRRDDVVETLHGVKVVDPYRWLETGDSPEVAAWTDAENSLTRKRLDAVPGRAALEARLWSLFEIGSLGAPVPRPLDHAPHRRWRYFYTRRDGKQNQPVLYVRDGLAGGDRPLVDANALAADGTRSLDWWFPSEDGRLVAYGISANGDEESVLRVRDVATGKDRDDVIPRTRACSVAWLPEGRGFYYTRYPTAGAVPAGEETYHRHVFFHELGTPPEKDRLVFGAGRDLKDWPSVALSPDGRWLGIEISQGWSKSEIYLVERRPGAAGAAPEATPLTVVAGKEAIFDLVEITNDALFVRTNEEAPRYRLFRVPLPRAARAPSPRSKAGSLNAPPAADSCGSWKLLIAEGPDALQQVAVIGKTLAALYLTDAASRVSLADRDGRVFGEVTLPMLGTVSFLSGHPEGNEVFLPFTSFLSPTAVLREPLGSDGSARRKAAPRAVGGAGGAGGSAAAAARLAAEVWQQIPSPVTASDFTVIADRVRSKDGTMFPLFLVSRRDVARDGTAPAMLYGYGGFNVDITPTWAATVIPFLERGGVYALAVLRGGGEYGEAWHQAGMLGRKQNVFDDFIAAAEHLVKTRVTSPERLAITGRSNGGLLMGAALTQRPDLFRAVVCGVPLLDMVRYHRFRIARLWIPEYGSADDAEAFRWLFAYSPYHHVKDGTRYPAVLFSTAASDTRVDPLHARKMTARLQAASSSGRPVLLRLETQAGHGAGKPLAKVVAQTVDEWSFLFSELGLAR